MKVLSSLTKGEWKDAGGEDGDVGRNEANRVLSELFRSNNLVVLAGLGTSLCVTDAAGKSLAPTMQELWRQCKEAQAALGGPDWGELLQYVRHDPSQENIEALLSRCRSAEDFLDGEHLAAVKAFITEAESCVTKSVDFVRSGHHLPAHSEFLRRAARRSNRRARTKLFTTNYDRCFEEAGRQGRFVVLDGFSFTLPPTFDSVNFTYDIVRREATSSADDFIPNVFQLYKLHGSIDWERDEKTSEIHRVGSTSRPLLIFPRNTKYELAFSQPYLEMMSALQAALREPNTGLLIVGFGFNDNHIAEPILSAIRSNLALKVAVVGPWLAPFKDKAGAEQLGETATNPHLGKIRGLALEGDARLALLNASFSELAQELPDVVAESDLERHLERVRKLEPPERVRKAEPK